jgi:AhpD family alkylhydroperoxidase
MNFKDELAVTSRNLKTLRKVQPNLGAGFSALHKASIFEGAVSIKHKELIALAIGIARQCEDCIGFHVTDAIQAGATRDEVAETIAVAVMMGGGPSFMYGARAMDAFDQLSD